ncbi:ABC transporter substrate-binding protein [Kyrpidia sp.]|uniref:substrate-binding periplasmic protein n=1 Tax=Kyrpidia sp. TaxID=2073077 RepID=UPI002584FD88|nr:ABC transporter substrate-binding protein [Kyrpidia sp.]MCL6574997.1 ABC transporter substrate-binding protein [Kyrpidia sp.]
MRRLKWMAILSLGLMGFVAACASNGASPAPGQSALQAIKQQGTIRVGVTTTGVPFTFLNTKTNQIDGVMVDVANEVAKDLGVKVQLVEASFSGLIPSLQSNKIDMISAGMFKTADRAKIIDFSNPVYHYGEGLVVPKGTSGIHSLEDLKGKTVGAQDGTVFLTGLKQNYPDIQVQSYKSIGDMITDVRNGRLSAFVADYPIMVYMLRTNPDLNVQLVSDYKPHWTGDVCLGLPKGASDLDQAVNKALDQMKGDGRLHAILQKWGLSQ